MDNERGVTRREFLKASVALATACALPTPEKSTDERAIQFLSVHVGAHSIDRNDLTQEEIESAVEAIVSNMPNVTHITIGTYFDYEEQIEMWVNAIHKYNKKACLRSAGFTSWPRDGAFGHPADGTPEQHRKDIVEWIKRNGHIFQDGDIFEALPDEASNGAYWFIDGKEGVGANEETLEEFNEFLQMSTADARKAFDEHGRQGVIVEVYHDNPAVIKDALTDKTVEMLKVVGSDNYPEVNATTPEQCAFAMLQELNDWVIKVHEDKDWIITFGPSIYVQLDEEAQKEALEWEVAEILRAVVNLLGITIWQFGDQDIDNPPKSRLFDFKDGKWISRKATEAVAKIKVKP